MKPALCWVIAVSAGILTGLIAGIGEGIPAGWAVLIAVPITAGVLLAMLSLDQQSMTWHDVPPQQHTVTGHQASNLANQFDEAARDQHRFNVRVRPRLRALALATLRQRLHDLEDLDDERASLVLGNDLHTLLTDRDAKLPSPHRLSELLSRLEET
jgi:hypothetical protein